MIRWIVSFILCFIILNTQAQCPPGEVPDCNGNCYPASWIGDGVCDDGVQFPSDFMCQQFNFDNGDCDCPDGHFVDCSGNCWPNEMLQYLGNWHCNRGLWESSLQYFNHGPVELDFNCELFNFDNGDCITPGCTDPLAENYYLHADQDDGTCFYGTCTEGTMDCMGNCIPENWIGMNDCNGIADDPLQHLFKGAYPNALVQTLPTGDSPRGMCVLPDGSRAFVGSTTGVSVIDLTATSACEQTSFITTGSLMHSLTPSADGALVFGASYSDDKVKVFNTTTNALVATINVGDGPLKVWTGNTGEHVFVSCSFSNEVYMIDATSFAIEHIFQTGNQPRNICTSPDDTKLYVADWYAATMSAFSTNPPYSIIATVPVDYYPQAIWATPDDRYVLVANFGFDFSYDHCSVIRTADWQVIARLQTGAGPEDMVSIGENGQYLYVSNWGMPCCFYTAEDLCCSAEINTGSVTILALPDFDAIVPPATIPNPIPYIQSTLQTVPLNAEYSFGMAVHPDGQSIYIVNKDSHVMSVLGFEGLYTMQPGENCASSLVLSSLSACVENSTSCFHDNMNESCPFTEIGGADVVYSYTPSVSVSGTFSLCSSGYDTKLYVYEDSCEPGTAIRCNDDFCGVNGWRSHLDDVVLSPGHTYYVVVDGFGTTDQGDFELCFDVSCTSDINGDGIINVVDLLLLVANSGISYGTADLLMLISDFGSGCAY